MFTALLAMSALFAAALQGTASTEAHLPPSRRSAFPWTGMFLAGSLAMGQILAPPLVSSPPTLSWCLQPWRHVDVFHLVSNCFAILLLAASVERGIGGMRLFIVFLVSSFSALLVHRLVGSAAQAPLVGASAGVYGLLSAHALLFSGAPTAFGKLRWLTADRSALVAFLVNIACVFFVPDARWSAVAHSVGAIAGVLVAIICRVSGVRRGVSRRDEAFRLLERGESNDAAIRLAQILSATPDDDEARFALLEAQGSSSNRAAVDQLFGEAIAYWSTTRRYAPIRDLARRWRGSISATSVAPGQWLSIATAFENDGQYTTALDILDTLCRAHPRAPEAESARLRSARICLHHLREPSRATTLLEQFLEDCPSSPLAGHAHRLLLESKSGNNPVRSSS